MRYTQEAFDQIARFCAGTIETYYGRPAIRSSAGASATSISRPVGRVIINIIRDNATITNPPGEFVFCAADQLVLFGSHRAIDLALTLLNGSENDALASA